MESGTFLQQYSVDSVAMSAAAATDLRHDDDESSDPARQWNLFRDELGVLLSVPNRTRFASTSRTKLSRSSTLATESCVPWSEVGTAE